MARKKILMIDDDVDLARAVKIGVEAGGQYVVRVENDPKRGRLAARDFKPDIILLDVIMPGMDGGDVAAEIREDERLKDTPIIFLTSIVGKREADKKGGLIGEEEIIAKPATVDEILSRLEKTLAASR